MPSANRVRAFVSVFEHGRASQVDSSRHLYEHDSELPHEANAVDSVVTLDEPDVTDIFDVTLTNDAPETFPLGTTDIAWTAVDEHSNSTSRPQTVHIVDTTAPEIVAPEDFSIEATSVSTPLLAMISMI